MLLSRRVHNVGISRAQGSIPALRYRGSGRLSAALVESISYDTLGNLTWDIQEVEGLPSDAQRSEILEGYQLRPDQVRFAATDFSLLHIGAHYCQSTTSRR